MKADRRFPRRAIFCAKFHTVFDQANRYSSAKRSSAINTRDIASYWFNKLFCPEHFPIRLAQQWSSVSETSKTFSTASVITHRGLKRQEDSDILQVSVKSLFRDMEIHLYMEYLYVDETDLFVRNDNP